MFGLIQQYTNKNCNSNTWATWNKLTVGDADTLDSINSTSFARVDTDNTFAGDVTITGNITVNGTQ